MQRTPTTPLPILKLVSWFMTPFAIFLVIMGVIFGHPATWISNVAIGITFVTLEINFASMILLGKYPAKTTLIRNTRVGINYSLNIILIYLLLPYWPEIWLLLLLMSIATAIYDTLKATYIYCITFGVVLIRMAFLTSQLEGIQLGETLTHVALIVFLGPFINRLLHASKAGSAQ